MRQGILDCPALEKPVFVGKNALGQVDIVAEYKGRKFHGMGLATDIIESSAQALVHVINSIWRADQVAEQMERNNNIKSETV